MKYEIGINTNCECGDTLEETMRNIKAAGFEHVMLAAKSGGIAEGLETAKQVGLNVPYVHMPYRHPHGVAMIDLWREGAEREYSIKFFINLIKVCDAHGVRIAVMHPMNRSRQEDYPIDYALGIDSFRQILEGTRDCKIKLAIENLNLVLDKYLAIVLDNIADDRLGFCYDCGHHYLYTSDIDWMKKYGNRCFAVHVQDNMVDAEHDDDWGGDIHLLPFDGKVDFEKVMRDIANSSYEDVLMMELHREFKDKNQIYDLSPIDYLREAYNRGQKLVDMLKQYK